MIKLENKAKTITGTRRMAIKTEGEREDKRNVTQDDGKGLGLE